MTTRCGNPNVVNVEEVEEIVLQVRRQAIEQIASTLLSRFLRGRHSLLEAVQEIRQLAVSLNGPAPFDEDFDE